MLMRFVRTLGIGVFPRYVPACLAGFVIRDQEAGGSLREAQGKQIHSPRPFFSFVFPVNLLVV
jgi:hypothetical protein